MGEVGDALRAIPAHEIRALRTDQMKAGREKKGVLSPM